jgi:hypothetical protein
MLRDRELEIRAIIFLLLLFSHLWIPSLASFLNKMQHFSINLFIAINNQLKAILGWQLDSLLTIAIALSFWPIAIPWTINKLCKIFKKPSLPGSTLFIAFSWLIFMSSFIFMQQGLI